VLSCHDATDEDLPPKAFRKRAGDVVLVLRPTAARARAKRTSVKKRSSARQR
jgi:hypothetical protein